MADWIRTRDRFALRSRGVFSSETLLCVRRKSFLRTVVGEGALDESPESGGAAGVMKRFSSVRRRVGMLEGLSSVSRWNQKSTQRGNVEESKPRGHLCLRKVRSVLCQEMLNMEFGSVRIWEQCLNIYLTNKEMTLSLQDYADQRKWFEGATFGWPHSLDVVSRGL